MENPLFTIDKGDCALSGSGVYKTLVKGGKAGGGHQAGNVYTAVTLGGLHDRQLCLKGANSNKNLWIFRGGQSFPTFLIIPKPRAHLALG
jgi:hypothetical protein